jgi:nucleotide-binding universal stress UspA family protein
MRAEITFVRVVEAAGADWGERGALGKGTADSPASSAAVRQAQAYLDRIADHVAAPGVRVHSIVKQGVPARQIVAAAREIDADVIAMATHSRRGLGRLMFGSVAEAVLHESNLPVILIRAA